MTDSTLTPEAADLRYQSGEIQFSVCTLVNDWAQYQAMLDSFRAAGFGGCRKGDVVIGIGEEYRDRSAQFASVSPPA